MKSFVTHTTAFMTAYRFGYTGHEQEGDLAEGVYIEEEGFKANNYEGVIIKK